MHENEVTEILLRPYRRVLVPDAESGAVTATIPEFPGCIAEGESEAQALDNLKKVAYGWVESLVSRGVPVPPPTEGRDYSGKFPLRLPKSLHERASRLAEEDGVSLNTFLVQLIAERVGLRQANANAENFLRRAIQQLRTPRVVRFTGLLEEASTEPDYTLGPEVSAERFDETNEVASTGGARGILMFPTQRRRREGRSNA